MNIRSLIIAVILLAPAGGLLAFGPRGLRETPADRTVVRYWSSWAGVEAVPITALVRRFNDTVGKERGIWVDLHEVANIDERMLIATAGGDPPDVATSYDRLIPQLAARGALLDITALAPQAGVRLAEFNPIWREIGQFDGKLYGLPCAPYTVALFYNRKLYREAGLDPDHPPSTIVELEEYSRRLTKVGANKDIVQLGFTAWPGMLGWWPWCWPFFFDAPLWDGRRFHLDTPQGRAALEWLAAGRRELGSAAFLKFETSNMPIEGADNPFLSGKLAMVFQGPWMTNWINRYKPDLDYGVAAFPSVSADRHFALASADLLVIPATAHHPHEAMVFIEFLLRPESQEELALSHGKLTPYRRPSEDFFARHRNPHIRTFAALAESPDAFGNPKMPMFGEAWTELRFVVESVLRDVQTPAQAARGAQEKLDRIVAEYWKMQARREAP